MRDLNQQLSVITRYCSKRFCRPENLLQIGGHLQLLYVFVANNRTWLTQGTVEVLTDTSRVSMPSANRVYQVK